MKRVRDYLRWLPAKLGYRTGPKIASWLRKRWLLFRNPHADIRFEGAAYLGPGFSLHIPDGGEFVVGHGVEFRRNFRAEVASGARIVIGARSIMTYDVLMQCSTSIEIGENVMVGHCSSIYDGNHRYDDHTRPFLEQGYDFEPIRIGDGAVIHGLCTIISSIGERALIGANAVVNKPVPAWTVAAGVPARPIRYFGPEESRPPEPAVAR